jgi:HEAT repeat protein
MAGHAGERHTAGTVWTAALAWAIAVLAGDPAGRFEWPGAAAVDAQDLTSLDRGQRLRAAERLSSRDGPEARGRLAALLTDGDPQVRVTAGRILARLGAPEAIEAGTRWATSVTPADRRLGLDVLRESSGPLPPAALRAIERSLSDGESTIRLLAIDTLSRQDDPRRSFLPIVAASEDDSREVRLRAVRLLGASHDARAAMPLLARLGDGDRQVRVEAIAAIGAVGDVRASAALIRLLADPADDVRIAATLALGKLKIAAAVPALIALQRHRPTDEVARQAALALGEIGGAPAIAALIDGLREPPPLEEVAEALRRTGAAAIPALLAEAAGGTATSSTAAATLLGQLRAGTGRTPAGADRSVTRTLLAIVDRRSSATDAALAALGAIRDAEAVAGLVRAAADPVPEIRRAVFQALTDIGDDRALIVIERGLGDRDAQVRALALRMGAELGVRSPAALAMIVTRLGDDDGDVRRQAVATLAGLRQKLPGAAAGLIAMLQQAPADPAIADALELQVDPADDALLVAAAARVPPQGRAAIARALGAAHTAAPLADPRAIDVLLHLLGEDGANAEAAAEALAAARGLPPGGPAALLRAFADAEPGARARLCAALIDLGGEAGRARLARAIDDEAEIPDVRAAAAWAAAGGVAGAVHPNRPGTPLGDALARAANAAHPAVSANARAALAKLGMATAAATATAAAATVTATGDASPRRREWAGVRLVAADGTVLAGRWLALTASDGTTVWTRSGLDGVAHLHGLPAGPYQVKLMEPSSTARAAAADAARAP